MTAKWKNNGYATKQTPTQQQQQHQQQRPDGNTLVLATARTNKEAAHDAVNFNPTFALLFSSVIFIILVCIMSSDKRLASLRKECGSGNHQGCLWNLKEALASCSNNGDGVLRTLLHPVGFESEKVPKAFESIVNDGNTKDGSGKVICDGLLCTVFGGRNIHYQFSHFRSSTILSFSFTSNREGRLCNMVGQPNLWSWSWMEEVNSQGQWVPPCY